MIVTTDQPQVKTVDGVVIQPCMVLYGLRQEWPKDAKPCSELVMADKVICVAYVGSRSFMDTDKHKYTPPLYLSTTGHLVFWSRDAARQYCRDQNKHANKRRSQLRQNAKARERRAAKKQEPAP